MCIEVFSIKPKLSEEYTYSCTGEGRTVFLEKKTASAIMLTLLLTSMLTLAFNIRLVKAEGGTIYIRADGSVDPPTANITSIDNVTYTFIGNIYDEIVVERDNIMIDGAGYTLHGAGTERGISLYGRSNVTIKSLEIKAFPIGIYLEGSTNNTLFGNNIANNVWGINLWGSSKNVISRSNVANNRYGIWLFESSNNNTISGNNVTASSHCGLQLIESSSNIISGNNFENNTEGIAIGYSLSNIVSKNNITNNGNGIVLGLQAIGNAVYHNNFVNNSKQVYTSDSVNVWDSGYPSGGNYWSDYEGVDADGDGIGDSAYVIDANNQDRYPLMHPWSPLPVHNINTGLGYATIQEAINASETLNGHTIFVEAGTYYEHVVVNKDNLTLIGENKSTTIIDGNGTGTVVYITASNVLMSEFTVLHGSFGIHLYYCGNNTIRDNMISNNYCDIYLQNSSLNMIANNTISISSIGLGGSLYSSNNTIRGNIFFDNSDGIDLYFYSDANFIYGNTVSNCDVGLRLGYANDNIIDNNNITSNRFVGVYLDSYSYRNKIKRNTIANNNRGINHLYSENNTIYHNNFVNNTQLPEANTYAANIWDDGYPSGGNYWSDYTGVDSNYDGIGDVPYIIGVDNMDQYPLMGIFSDFIATPEYHVQIVCNSTISNFRFTGTAIIFNVSGEAATTGFCRICIPAALMSGPYKVHVDGVEIPYSLLFANRTHNYLYFTYSHSTHEIVIGALVGMDENPPVIGTPFQEPEPDNVMSDQVVTVYVNVTDAESGVRNVILSYTTNSGTTWTNLTMLYNMTAELYEATIPGFPSGTFVCYKIIAYDNAGNVAIDDNSGQYHCYTVNPPIPPPLSASISPLSASILAGQSVTFTSTVSGGYMPYSYQWYLNGAPVSGATSNTWTLTPTTSGIYYVHLKVTDDKANTTQSQTARITVATVPVGGYSIPIQSHTVAKPSSIYLAIMAILTAAFTTVKRKTHKRRK